MLNAAAFIGGNYLARALGGGDKAALDEKVRHDKALEVYQAAYAKYTRDRTKLLDWIATNTQINEEAKQNFTNTDYAFKLYNQAHPDKQMIPPKEPKFSDFYQPSEQQKKGELIFVGAGALALGYAAFRFLQTFLLLTYITRWMPNSQRYSTALVATGKVLQRSKNYPKLPRYQKKTQKSGCSSKHSGRSSSPHRSAFLGLNSTCLHPTRSTRRIFFFCRTTNCPAGAKFSNTHSPLWTWPAATKRLNP